MKRNRFPLSLGLLVLLASVSPTSRGQPQSHALAPFDLGDQIGFSSTFQVALGDLDGDGDLDAVFSNMDRRSEIWMNRGDGSFSNSYQLLSSGAHGADIGDLDGDGDQDIVLTHASRTIGTRVYWNNGVGRVSAATNDFGDTSLNANALSVFDAEGDGDLDVGIYYLESIRYSTLYLNQGDGNFVPSGVEIPGSATWGDVDKDGDTDAVTHLHDTNNGFGLEVYLNDGENGFSATQHLREAVPFFPGSLGLGDIDGDGDLDLVTGGGAAIDDPIKVFLNAGSGVFRLVPNSQFGEAAGRITLGDVNGDDLADVLLGGIAAPVQLGLSNGDGTFADSGTPFETYEMLGISAIGDVDQDGDGDLVLAVYGQAAPNDVWLNHMP